MYKRQIQAEEITRNIKEMCIEANHVLSDDMKNVDVYKRQGFKYASAVQHRRNTKQQTLQNPGL